MLFKVRKSDFLIRKCSHEFCCLFVFFKSVLIRSNVSYLIFHILLLLKDKNICPAFPCFPGHFDCHYYFHYVCLWGYKKLPLHLQVSNIRQCKINWTQHYGTFSKHFQTKARTASENHWWTKNFATLLHNFRFPTILVFLKQTIWH